MTDDLTNTNGVEGNLDEAGGDRVVYDRHVSRSEANDALAISVGDGTPSTAPEIVPEPGHWVEKVETIGVSPKVAVPATAGLIVGAALLVLGVVLEDEALKTIGGTMLATAIGGGVLGYRAPAADVEPVDA